MKAYTKNKLVYGVGINDADYRVVSRHSNIEDGSILVRKCPFYTRWVSMLARSYSPSLHLEHPTYAGCSVCDEWIYFSNFKSWMQSQDWQDKHLDKDLLIPGNKIYSPETCVFVESKVNNFLTESTSARGNYPIGVNLDKGTGKFKAQCYNVVTSKKEYLGLFNSPDDAHKAWLAFKLEQAKILATGQQDKRVAEALIYLYENYKS